MVLPEHPGGKRDAVPHLETNCWTSGGCCGACGPAAGRGLPYLPEKRAQGLSEQMREAFADKRSLPRKGVLHSPGDGTDSSGMLCVQAHLLSSPSLLLSSSLLRFPGETLEKQTSNRAVSFRNPSVRHGFLPFSANRTVGTPQATRSHRWRLASGLPGAPLPR